MRRVIGSLVPVVAGLAMGSIVITGEEPIVPVYHEPHHRQVFQSGPIRILDVQIPPGDSSWYHTHDSPIFYVTLSSSQTRIETLGEASGAGGRGRGDGNAPGARGAGTAAAGRRGGTPGSPPPNGRISSTTSYREKPVTHKVQNVGDRLFRPIAVINETAGNDATTPQMTGFTGEPELTNKWFRGYRLAVEPGQTIASHRHTTPSVIIQTTDGHALAVGPMTFDLTEPGRWAFFEANQPHEIRNVGATRVEMVEVEVREPTN